MTRRTPPPRTRPSPPEDTALDGAALSAQDRSQAASDPAAAAVPAASADSQPVSPGDWRAKLDALAQTGALTPAQEADFFRLLQTQEAELREGMQHLLAELQPHFDTEREAEAKQRFTEGLHALKHRQEEEVSRLLASMGIESRPPGAA